jgi:hypothetical protein
MTTANDVLKHIRDNDVKFADFRLTERITECSAAGCITGSL